MMLFLIAITVSLIISILWWKFVIPNSAKSDPMLFAERNCKCNNVPKNWKCGPL